MRKHSFILLILACLTSQQVYADFATVKNITDFPIITYGARYETLPIQESSAVTHIVGGADSGFYRIDLETGQKTLLVRTPEIGYWVSPILRPYNDQVLMDMGGKLYVSNGTPGGTVLLGDFGYDSMGGSPGQSFYSNVTHLSVLNKDIYFNVKSYEQGGSLEQAIWKSDGTRLKTKPVLTSQGRSHGLLRGSVKPGENVLAFGWDPSYGYSFWAANSAASTLTHVASFENPQSDELAISYGTWLDTGFVFCRTNYAETENSLWRLSRNGVLTRLEEGCGEVLEETINNGQNALMIVNDELWKTDGRPGAASKVAPDVFLREGYTSLVCHRDGHYFFEVYSNEPEYKTALVELNSHDMSITVSQETYAANCFDNYLAIRTEVDSRNTHFLQHIKSGEKTRIYRLGENVLIDYYYERGFELNDALYVTATVSDDSVQWGQFGRILKISIKDGSITDFMPAVNLLLLERD